MLAAKRLMMTTAGVAIPPPIMAFEFNETSGTVATDSIGGRTANLDANEAWTTAQTGRGIQFLNATHTGLVVSGTDVLATPNAPFTVEALVNLSAFTDAFPVIILLKSGVANNPLILMFSNSTQYLGVFAGSATTFAKIKTNDPANSATNIWFHVVLTYNGNGSTTASNYKIYRNNVNKTLTTGGTISSLTDATLIGTFGATSSQWVGKMDFLRVYNYEMTAAQVAAQYALTGL